ncbi:MAG TPA: hypothetical protein DGF10_05800 [Acidimicrobiaceae bacterium]|nr:hypothetical protein [Acidimicrobiaceae bacterium]
MVSDSTRSTGDQFHFSASGRKRRLGAWYTPDDVVGQLLDLTLTPLLIERRVLGLDAVAALRVLDPSCGDGAFLVAAADRIYRTLVEMGLEHTEALRTAYGCCVVGVDVDPLAVDRCRHRLGEAGATAPDSRVVVADALLTSSDEWSDLLERWDTPAGVTAVIGNPPFLNPLAADTAADPNRAVALRQRFGSVAQGYSNPAFMFLVLATELAASRNSVVALIQPLSLLATRGSTASRAAVLENWTLDTLWVANQRVFDASVDVCAPVLRPRGESDLGSGLTKLLAGRSFHPVGTAPSPNSGDATWSRLLATVRDVPDVPIATDGILGDDAIATADFRDQYYGLDGQIVELPSSDRSMPRLLTAGLVDPAHDRWGETTTRFHKNSWHHPRVRLDGLSDDLRRWVDSRLVPKVVVATQTRVLEAVVDSDGSCLPSVPLVTITPRSDKPKTDLWHIAALLTSPPATMVAARRHLGAALTTDGLKLRARDLAALPRPHDHAAWHEAAKAFQRASDSDDQTRRKEGLVRCGRLMCTAFGVADFEHLLAWWVGRLPGQN